MGRNKVNQTLGFGLGLLMLGFLLLAMIAKEQGNASQWSYLALTAVVAIAFFSPDNLKEYVTKAINSTATLATKMRVSMKARTDQTPHRGVTS